MSDCKHDLAERDTAVADGLCPLCLTALLSAKEAELADVDRLISHYSLDTILLDPAEDEIVEKAKARHAAREAAQR